MEYELFQAIVTSPNYTLPATQFHTEERTIRNTNALTSNWKYLGYLYSKVPAARRAAPTRPASAWWRPPRTGTTTSSLSS